MPFLDSTGMASRSRASVNSRSECEHTYSEHFHDSISLMVMGCPLINGLDYDRANADQRFTRFLPITPIPIRPVAIRSMVTGSGLWITVSMRRGLVTVPKSGM